jgi:hypothetical protein
MPRAPSTTVLSKRLLVSSTNLSIAESVAHAASLSRAATCRVKTSSITVAALMIAPRKSSWKNSSQVLTSRVFSKRTPLSRRC